MATNIKKSQQVSQVSTNINISINSNKYQQTSTDSNAYQQISTNRNNYQQIPTTINKSRETALKTIEKTYWTNPPGIIKPPPNISKYQQDQRRSKNINEDQQLSTKINKYQQTSIQIN